MRTSFSVSGFLHHSPSQQILLQQLNNDPNLVLFGTVSQTGMDPQAVFQQCVEKTLGMTIKPESIVPIYDYTLENVGEQFIFYVEVADIEPISSKNKTKCLLLSKLSKFPMSEQTRHDIIIGERVIRSRMESPPPRQYPHL